MYASGYRKRCLIQPVTDKAVWESSQEPFKRPSLPQHQAQAPTPVLLATEELVSQELALEEVMELVMEELVSQLSVLVTLRSCRRVLPQSELPQLPRPSTRRPSSKISQVRYGLISAESRLEYIPYQKAYIEYDQIERVEQIPVQRVITEYEQVVRAERVPVERLVQDYYAVEYQTEYVPRVIEEKVIDYVQQEKVFERVQYTPYETYTF
jgi:hypothetical protein